MEGYKDQDARLNAMDRIVTDLYGMSVTTTITTTHTITTLSTTTTTTITTTNFVTSYNFYFMHGA